MRPTAAIHERAHSVRLPLWLQVPVRYFITGAPLVRTGDNASFLHDATEDYRGKPVTKLTRARWRRVLRRNAFLTMPPLLLLLTPRYVLPLYCAGLAAWTVVTLTQMALSGLARATSYFSRRRQIREWTDPAAALACRVLAVPYVRSQARLMVDLPPRWGEGTEKDDGERKAVRLSIPPQAMLTPAVRKNLVSLVGARLGIPNPVAEWSEAGSHPAVILMAAPVPPKEVTYASLAAAIKECAEDEVVVGRAPQGRIVTASLSEDSPHFLASGAAGTGKSVLARVILRQRVERGDNLIILDPKKWSHIRWARGLPRARVAYAYRTEDIHDAWLRIGEEQERRIEMDEEELTTQPRVFIAAEELNTQTKRLARYWKGKRKEIMQAARALGEDADPADLDPPLTSPAIVAMQESVCMGRELRMHLLCLAQRASASVFGGNGGDIRENFQGGRFVARWDRRLWKMLVDTVDYVACPSGPRGIWGVAKGEEFLIFRVPWLDEKEMATAMRLATATPALGQPVAKPALANPVTLANALARLPGQDGPMAIELATLRKAANRDPSFPEPLAKPDGQPYGVTEARLYDLSALLHWREGVLG